MARALRKLQLAHTARERFAARESALEHFNFMMVAFEDDDRACLYERTPAGHLVYRAAEAVRLYALAAFHRGRVLMEAAKVEPWFEKRASSDFCRAIEAASSATLAIAKRSSMGTNTRGIFERARNECSVAGGWTATELPRALAEPIGDPRL